MFWLFSSKPLENITAAKERLLWGFWDKKFGEKLRKNWRRFLVLYNRIKPFDIVVFQIAKTGEIHAIGIVKEKFYDDQTPIWPKEREKNKVFFPWRVSFSMIIFSEKPITTHFIKVENYVDGYGIGEISEHDFRRILESLKDKLSKNELTIEINFG